MRPLFLDCGSEDAAHANTVDKCHKSAFIYSDPSNLLMDVKMFVKQSYAIQLFDKLQYQAAISEILENDVASSPLCSQFF